MEIGAIVFLLVLVVYGLMSIEARIEREARRSRMSEVDREMDDLNPNGFS
jgi:hypothetical protein